MTDKTKVRLGEVRDAYVACRTIGHSWDDMPPVSGEPILRLRCVRCTMERLDTVSVNTGHVVRRRYKAPEGYYLSATVEKPPKDEWRREFLIITGIATKKGTLR